MSSLPTPLRRQLEGAVTQARKVAEGGARHALEALAVHEPKPYEHMKDEAQRGLRNKLRAQAKQLGDGESQTKRGAYEIKHLAEKLAYDQWHRLLFARYLLENNLLISPEHEVSVILEGEPPYDIFVRWKSLLKQAVGWHPDLNYGVRINIRPFATADILRKRVKIKWDKDRGKEPVREKKEFPWFWGWDGVKQDFAGVGKEPDGNRWNDCHYSNEFKHKAKRG